MRIISTDGRRESYTLLQTYATHFLSIALLFFLAGCSKVSTPTQPEEVVEDSFAPLQTDQAVPSTEKEPFNIELIWSEWKVLTATQKGYIVEAKEMVESLIVEGLPDTTFYTSSSMLWVIDDLLIEIVVTPFSASSDKTVASAGSGKFRYTDPGLPSVGTITLYPKLTDGAFTASQWKTIIIHEMLHVLGFGELMQNRIERINGVDFFNGENAILAYREILYDVMNEKTAFAIPDLRVPMQEDLVHWKAPELQWDIMQPYLNVNSAVTKVTLGALADLGYVVDMTKAKTPHWYLTKPAIGSGFICKDGHTHLVTSP